MEVQLSKRIVQSSVAKTRDVAEDSPPYRPIPHVFATRERVHFRVEGGRDGSASEMALARAHDEPIAAPGLAAAYRKWMGCDLVKHYTLSNAAVNATSFLVKNADTDIVDSLAILMA